MMTDIFNRDTDIATGNPAEFHPCHACGTMTHIDLLDAKPDDPSDPDGSDWNRLECRPCYGRGWAPALESQWPPLERRVRALLYALHMARFEARMAMRRALRRALRRIRAVRI
jgi:hypothetical protein